MNTLPTAKELQPTRDYMQDISRIIVQAQRTYAIEQEHYWHMGLLIDGQKIVSQELTGEVAQKKFMINFAIHLFHTPWGTINIEGKSPEEVFIELNDLSDIELSKPEFSSSDTTSYVVEYAESIMSMFAQINETLVAVKSKTTTLTTSPILLYPHHFDLSLVTFLTDDDEHQFAIGVSTGDAAIEEPYLYILTGPYHAAIVGLDRPDFMKLESKPFKGLSASISSIIESADADSQIIDFHAAIVTILSK
jgi:hypothetical protein